MHICTAMSSEIREFVRAVLKEASNPDAWTVGGREAWHGALLTRYGLEVGKRLGAGVFSTAYEAIARDGRPVVVKLSASADEYKPYLKVKQVSNRLPGYIAKHLPEVLVAETLEDVFQSKMRSEENYDDDSNDEGDAPWSIVIMEPLKPLGNELKQRLLRYSIKDAGAEERKNRAIRINEELWDSVIRAAFVNVGQKARMPLLPPGSAASEREMIKIAQGAARRGNTSVPKGEWRRAVGFISPNEKLMKIIHTIGDELEYFLRRRAPDETYMSKIVRYVSTVIVTIASGVEDMEFPTYYVKSPSVNAPGMLQIPETKGLMRAVSALASIYPDMKWGDLHGNNLMLRPATGDIVISDLGFFAGEL